MRSAPLTARRLAQLQWDLPEARRIKPRFRVDERVRLFFAGAPAQLEDLSENGFRVQTSDGAVEYTPGTSYPFDLVFVVNGDVHGWSVFAECRWAKDGTAGFLFWPGAHARDIATAITALHLTSRFDVVNGTEL